eukprot:g2195.t1
MMDVLTKHVKSLFSKNNRAHARTVEALRVPLLRGFNKELKEFQSSNSDLESLKKRLRWAQDISLDEDSESFLFSLAVMDENIEALKTILRTISASRVSEILSYRISFTFLSKIGIPDGITCLQAASFLNTTTRESKDVNQQGTRPLHYAITRGDMELVDLLVSVGAIGMVDEEHNENLDVHQFNRTRTVLLMAGGGLEGLSSKIKSIVSGGSSDSDI